MGQEQSPHDYDDQPDLERTQPSPTRPPRRLDWRPVHYQSDRTGSPQETQPMKGAKPLLRRVSQPGPRRHRPPTEGAPAWLVGGLVGVLAAVILGLVLLFVLSRPSAKPKPTVTVFVVTPTATFAPRPTTAVPSLATVTLDADAEATAEAPAVTAPPPDVIGIGGYVRVVAPAGLSFRQTAGTDGAVIEYLDAGTVLEVIGGPQDVGDFTWWQLRKLDSGQEGWSAAGLGEDVFLEPAPAP
jgi:hypothetical protein